MSIFKSVAVGDTFNKLLEKEIFKNNLFTILTQTINDNRIHS